MSYVSMTMHALQSVLTDRSTAGNQVVNKIAMTTKAGLLKDITIPFFDLDRFMKIHESEPFAMPKTVIRLRDVFGDEIMG